MKNEQLTALMDGRVMGVVSRKSGGQLSFAYDAMWRESRDAIPLSVSMPLARAEHGHEVVDPWLSGLLPDNEEVLRRWGQRCHVSARNTFGLLSHVGEDCAGAAQLVREERLAAVMSNEAWDVEWLEEGDIETRLGALQRDRSAWRSSRDTGQFSLAGAQPKTALLFEDGRFGVPSGRAPTTHILKPPIPEFDGHVENEHLCLALAREFDLPTAHSKVQWFGEQVAIVIERYDRLRITDSAGIEKSQAATLAQTQPILRVHQEDTCQALGVHPSSKYQNEGGPSPEDVVNLLRANSSRAEEDVQTFVMALAFNWLIAGTDAHAKNYSILHGHGRNVRLAPLYDLASALPYEDMDPQRIRLAMKIGGKYRLRDVARRQWENLSTALALDPQQLVEKVCEMAARVPDAMSVVCERARRDQLAHPIIGKLEELIAARAEYCLSRLH